LASSNAQKGIHRSLHPLTGSFGVGFTNFVRNLSVAANCKAVDGNQVASARISLLLALQM
jgi:hypothetical protein